MFYYQAKFDRTPAKYVGSCEMEFKCNNSFKMSRCYNEANIDDFNGMNIPYKRGPNLSIEHFRCLIDSTLPVLWEIRRLVDIWSSSVRNADWTGKTNEHIHTAVW